MKYVWRYRLDVRPSEQTVMTSPGARPVYVGLLAGVPHVWLEIDDPSEPLEPLELSWVPDYGRGYIQGRGDRYVGTIHPTGWHEPIHLYWHRDGRPPSVSSSYVPAE
jgi:hypothetical protein